MFSWLQRLLKPAPVEPASEPTVQGKLLAFDLPAAFASAGLGGYADRLPGLQKSCVAFDAESCTDDEIAVGESKLGGLADLPASTSWPMSGDIGLQFVAQIRLADVSGFGAAKVLPAEGLLSFFFDGEVWGFDPEDREGWAVIWSPPGEALVRKAAPEDLGECGVVFDTCRIVPREGWTLPSREGEDPLGLGLDEEQQFAFNDIARRLSPDCLVQLLGHPNPIQGEMEGECQLASGGVYRGHAEAYNNPRHDELIKSKDDWQLLLQVDSNEKSNMMWGDYGMIYYWIRKQDLAERRFENVWMILQCS